MRVGSGNFWQFLRRVSDTVGAATDAASARSVLGLGALATKNTIDSSALIDPAVVQYSDIQNVTASRLLGNPTGGAAAMSEIGLVGKLAFSGTTLQASILQHSYQQIKGPQAGVTALIPSDSSTPLITEGTQAFSSGSFTPTTATSRIKIWGNLNVGFTGASCNPSLTLWNATSGSLLGVFPMDNASNVGIQMPFYYEEVSGSTSARTYTLRYGPGTAATATINDGGGGGTDYGNNVVSVFIIEEVLP